MTNAVDYVILHEEYTFMFLQSTPLSKILKLQILAFQFFLLDLKAPYSKLPNICVHEILIFFINF